MRDRQWSIVLAVISSALTAAFAIIGALVIGKIWSKLKLQGQMKSYGFSRSSKNVIPDCDLRFVFDNAVRLKILFVSGKNFFLKGMVDSKIIADHILEFGKAKGKKVQILLCDPTSTHIGALEESQKEVAIRKYDEEDIVSELVRVRKKFSGGDGRLADGIEIRYFVDLYQLPVVIAEFENGDIHAWLCIHLNPATAAESFWLFGKDSGDSGEPMRAHNFVKMMKVHFDSQWNRGSEQ